MVGGFPPAVLNGTGTKIELVGIGFATDWVLPHKFDEGRKVVMNHG